MTVDRITEIRIEGMRCIDSLQLPLRGLTVLIGENGTGKSTIIEATDLLRRVPGSRAARQAGAGHRGV